MVKPRYNVLSDMAGVLRVSPDSRFKPSSLHVKWTSLKLVRALQKVPEGPFVDAMKKYRDKYIPDLELKKNGTVKVAVKTDSLTIAEGDSDDDADLPAPPQWAIPGALPTSYLVQLNRAYRGGLPPAWAVAGGQSADNTVKTVFSSVKYSEFPSAVRDVLDDMIPTVDLLILFGYIDKGVWPHSETATIKRLIKYF